MIKNDEHTIVKLLKEKDPRGMSLLYDRYADPIYGIIARVCSDEKSAQDALQEFFVKVWKGIDTYDQKKAKLFTWMYVIAKRVALDHVRKDDKHQHTDIQNAFHLVSLSEGVREDCIDMAKNLSTLEPKYRDVIEALFFKGYSQREWSDYSGLPLGTIKTRLRIGLRELRKIYLEAVYVILIIIAMTL